MGACFKLGAISSYVRFNQLTFFLALLEHHNAVLHTVNQAALLEATEQAKKYLTWWILLKVKSMALKYQLREAISSAIFHKTLAPYWLGKLVRAHPFVFLQQRGWHLVIQSDKDDFFC